MTRTVSLADDAYLALQSLKEPGESFSDVARRLAAEVKRRRFLAAGGAWKDLPIDADAMKRKARKARADSAQPRRPA